jgi:MFS family permease
MTPRSLLARLQQLAGGWDRLTVVATLAAVLALDAADKGTIGATAANLQHAFSIGKVDIGLLLTVSSLVSALATLPFGVLVDRARRTRLLAAVVVLWALAMIAGAVAPSYLWLLLSRIFLGCVTAAAYPAIASLVGDWFPAGERGRILGLILAGELVGTGFGLAVSGGVASLLGWRAAFGILALPALGVAWLVHHLPEPDRDGGSRLAPEEPTCDAGATGEDGAAGRGPGRDDISVGSLVEDAGVEPDPGAVLHGDLEHLPLLDAVRYVLKIRTNVILIISSALGYYLFAGVRAFGMEYAGEHYGIGQGLASILVLVLGVGALVGVVLGGRISDRLLRHGLLDARIVVPAAAFLATAVLFAPALITTSLLIAVPLLIASGFCLAVANPPLDAARLDVVPSRLWGRAEAVRSVLRTTLEALAPLAFGAIAQHLFGGKGGRGLELTFLVMLVPLLASGLVLLLARRTYLADVATAVASAAATADESTRTGRPSGRDEGAGDPGGAGATRDLPARS